MSRLVNGENADDITRLQGVIRRGQDDLFGHYSHRQNALSAYHGARLESALHQNAFGPRDPRVSIPLFSSAVDLYEQLLAGETQRTIVRPRRQELLALSEALKAGGDVLIEGISLDKSFLSWVKETILSGTGVVKVGRSDEKGKVRLSGRRGRFNNSMSTPYVDALSLPDLLLDTQAEKWVDQQFFGNRYVVDLRWAKANKAFRRRAREELQPASPLQRRDAFGMSPQSMHYDSLGELTVLQDIWIPQDRRLLTIAEDGAQMALRDVPYVGPSIGPYHPLAFESVEKSVLGRAMSWDWIDLHDTASILWNIAVRQFQSAKVNPLVPPGAEKDAEAIRLARDRQYIPVSRNVASTGLPVHVIPGADPALLQFINSLMSVFSMAGGNTNLLSGLSAQSPTLGQDELLAGAGGRRIAELQRRSQGAMSGVIESLFWYIFRQEDLDATFERQVGGATVRMFLKHDDLRGRMLEFNFTIETIQYKSPEERLGLLLQFLREVLIPMQGQMAQSGQQIDMTALVRVFKNYAGVPEVDQIIRDVGRQFNQGEISALAGGRRAAVGQNAPGGAAGRPAPIAIPA